MNGGKDESNFFLFLMNKTYRRVQNEQYIVQCLISANFVKLGFRLYWIVSKNKNILKFISSELHSHIINKTESI